MRLRIPDALTARMQRLGIREEDIRETFSKPGGPGGQHSNKTSTAVEILHEPTGVTASASDSRSQMANRKSAIERLIEKIEQKHAQSRQAAKAEQARRRRQRARRSAGTKAEMLDAKRRRGQKKDLRKKITG